MSAYIIDTTTAELLSRKYGLRACEIVEKNRLLSYDAKENTIRIQGKRGMYGVERPRNIHIRADDFKAVLKWYSKNIFYLIDGELKESNKRTITYQTLYNRLKGTPLIEPHKKTRTITHRGRKDRYKALPKGSDPEAYLALAEELGHSFKVGMEYYNQARIEEARKESLKYLPRL